MHGLQALFSDETLFSCSNKVNVIAIAFTPHLLVIGAPNVRVSFFLFVGRFPHACLRVLGIKYKVG